MTLINIVASDKKYDIPYGVCEISKWNFKKYLESRLLIFLSMLGFIYFLKR